MVEVYKSGDSYVWIPVAAKTDKHPKARAFLPDGRLNKTYLYGYKANTLKGSYLVALTDIQKAFIEDECMFFPVKNGWERQYKARWRHGEGQNAPLLKPEHWVKVDLSANSDVNDVLAKDLENSDCVCYEQVELSISPILCTTNEELIEQVKKIKKTIGESVPQGQKNPRKTSSNKEVYERDATVVAYVLKDAGGVCDCCDNPAPFTNENEEPFLEGHHVKHLAKGGSDTISNTIAVCPNCHRELHYGANNTKLVEKLYSEVTRLTRE